jgi:hypothetical protein
LQIRTDWKGTANGTKSGEGNDGQTAPRGRIKVHVFIQFGFCCLFWCYTANQGSVTAQVRSAAVLSRSARHVLLRPSSAIRDCRG